MHPMHRIGVWLVDAGDGVDVGIDVGVACCYPQCFWKNK